MLVAFAIGFGLIMGLAAAGLIIFVILVMLCN